MNIGAIILSGGRGERFGFREKGLIPFKGESLIARKVRQLAGGFTQIIVVTNMPDLYRELPCEVRLVTDDMAYQGPLRGLYCGLMAANADMNFVCAVDMPFISYELLDCFRKSSAGFDAVVGKIDGRVEPLFGFYSKNLIPSIESVLSEPTVGLTGLIKMARSNYIAEDVIKKFDPELSSFVNLNTTEDLKICCL
ncbi:MAG: molybdenum cofactor guanylyltransferase [Pseudomonadota bacterium]